MGWEIALAGIVLLLGGALAGAGVALARASQHPSDLEAALQQLRAERARDKAELAELTARASQHPSDLEAALHQLRAERARDKAELAELAERMMDAGDRIQRARSRHETARQRAEQKEEAAKEGQPMLLSELEQVKLRARRLGKL